MNPTTATNWWEQFCLAFKDVMNQPVPIIGISVGALIILVLSIFSKTSIGKKALNEFKNGLSLIKAEIVAFTALWKKKEKELEDFKVKAMEDIEGKLAEKDKKIEELETLIIEIGTYINNKKIKDRISKYLENK